MRTHPFHKQIAQIKWYSPTITNTEGYNIYRRGEGIEWTKLNSKPIRFKDYLLSKKEIEEDKELSNYVDLVNKSENIKDLTFIAVLVKSFKSEPFSFYLGIRFDDTLISSEGNYEYRITKLTGSTEEEIAISQKFKAVKYTPIDAPKQIKFKTANKSISFSWEPEPNRYWGVNIYRSTEDSAVPKKINNDPIILSKTKDGAGKEVYGETFFIDQQLKPETTYHYTFEALDFFGSPSKLSAPIAIRLKDLEAPSPPDSISLQVSGKRVLVNWRKQNKEADHVGYNVYRTNKNDTDFTKINQEPISTNEFHYNDMVSKFGSYLYAISSIDQSENERRSNSHLIEVYDNEPPSPPKSLKIESDTGRILIKWSPNTEEDLKGYLIYRTIDKHSEDNYVKLSPRPISDTFYEDKLAQNIKNTFFYRLVAVDQSLNRSAYSEFAMGKLPDITAPNAPFLKSVKLNSKNNISIEWFRNSEPDLAGYLVYRKNCGDSLGQFEKINVSVLSPLIYRYTDHHAKEGFYEYYVKAIDSTRNISLASNTIKFKVHPEKVNEETEFTHVEGRYNKNRGRVELKWKLKSEQELRGYIIFKRGADENTFSPISGIITETHFSDQEFTQNSKCYYELRAYSVRGDVCRSQQLEVNIN